MIVFLFIGVIPWKIIIKSDSGDSLMVIQEEIQIAAPMSVVWAVFSDVEEWDDWNTACQSCHLVEGGEMGAGAWCFAGGSRDAASILPECSSIAAAPTRR